MSIPIVTIDGPSASGKSSVSRELAQMLGWRWVSTGCFYRGLGFVALRERANTSVEAELVPLIASSVWNVRLDPEGTKVFYKDQDVTPQIHGESVGAVASRISQFPLVRSALLGRQRNCAANGSGLIAEGRDCGSVVFPDATLKVYLTADPEKRAQRRSLDENTNWQDTMELQFKRDCNDSQRKQAPMKVPDGALVVDSSVMSLQEVVDQVFAEVQKKLPGNQ